MSKKYSISKSMHELNLKNRETQIEQNALDIAKWKFEDQLKQQNPNASLKSEIKKNDRFRKRVLTEVEKQKQGIAPLFADKIEEFVQIGNDFEFITNKTKLHSKNPFAENKELINKYTNLNLRSNIYDHINKVISYGTNKTETGTELIEKVIKINDIVFAPTAIKTTGSIKHLKEAKAFFDQAEKKMVFDYETLGGINKFGDKAIDALTEIGYVLYNKEGNEIGEKSILFGVSETQAATFSNMINNAGGMHSNEINVLKRRLGLYGHKDTNIVLENGEYVIKKMADISNDYHFSEEEIKNGIKQLRKIYDQNQIVNPETGLSKAQEELVEFIKLLNDKTVAKAGQNINNADNIWTNHLMANLKMFGLNSQEQVNAFMNLIGLNRKHIDSSGKDFFDLLPVSRMAQANMGTNHYYIDGDKEILKYFSAMSQEAITTMYSGVEDVSHVGLNDSKSFGKLLFKKASTENGKKVFGDKTFLETVWEDSGIENIELFNVGSEGQALVYLDQSSRYTASNAVQPLSAVYDPLNNQFRTGNQYVLKDGNVVAKDTISETQIKRNRLYTIDYAGKIKTTNKWKEQMKGVHDQLSTDELYVLKMTPYMDEKIAKGHTNSLGYTYRFYTSLDEMQADIQNMNLLATGGKDNWKPNQKTLNGFKEYVFDEKEGMILKTAKPVTLENVVSQLTERDLNDTSSRMIREIDFTKSENFEKLVEAMDKYYGKPKGESATKEEVKQAVLDLMKSNNKTVASKIAKGETLTLDTVENAIGFMWNGHQKVLSNTVDNFVTAYDYLSSQRPIFKAINKVLTENGVVGKDKQVMFSQIMNNLIEQASIEYYENTGLDPQHVWFNTSVQSVYEKDLNYFSFNLEGKGYKNKKTSKMMTYVNKPSVDENILRIKLDENNPYSLINAVMGKYHPDYRSGSRLQNEAEKVTQLKNFIQDVRNSKQYPGIFEEFDNFFINRELKKDITKEYTSSEALARDVIRSLSNYRKDNPKAGYLGNTTVQKVDIVGKALNVLKNSNKPLEERVNKAFNESYHFKVLDKDMIALKANDIVKNVLMDQINPVEFAINAGASKQQAQYFKGLYHQVELEYTDYLSNLINAFTKVDGVNFGYNNKELFFERNGEVLPLALPHITAKDNLLYMNVGNTKVALYGKLSSGGQTKGRDYLTKVKFDTSKIHFATTFGEAIDSDLAYVFGNKAVTHNDPLKRLASYLKLSKKNWLENAAIATNDVVERESNYRFDVSEVMALTGLMQQSSMLDEGMQFRDSDFLSTITKDILDAKKKEKHYDYEHSSTQQRELYQKNIPILLNKLGLSLNDSTENIRTLKLAFNMLTNRGKESLITEGTWHVGMSQHLPGEQMTNAGRPVVDQAKSILYSKKAWDKVINKKKNNYYYEDGTSIVSTILPSINDWTKANRNINIEGIGETAESLAVKTANITQLDFQMGIAQRYLEIKNEKDQYIFNRLKSINLSEQEQLINARIMDDFFARADYQKISADKKLADLHKLGKQALDDLKLNEIIPEYTMDKNGNIKFKYKKGVIKEANEELLRLESYGETEYSHFAKKAGIFKFGYFTETGNMLVDDKIITQELAKQGIKTKEEAEAYLAKKYKANWYLVPKYKQSYKKFLQDYQEKGMTSAYYVGLGDLNKNVYNFFEEFATTEKGKKLGTLLGNVHSEEFMNDFVLNFNDKETKAIIINNGFNSVSELKAAIKKEQYEIQDEIDRIFGKVGLISNQAKKKHKNVQLAFDELLLNMREANMKNGMTVKEANDKIFKELTKNNLIKIAGLKQDKVTGALYYPEQLKGGEDFYDPAAIFTFLQDHKEYRHLALGEDLIKEFNINGKTQKYKIGKYSNTIISEVASYQGISGHTPEELNSMLLSIDQQIERAGKNLRLRRALENKRDILKRAYNYNSKGQKITQRELQILNFNKYDKGFIDRTLKAMNGDTKEFERIYGHILEKDSEGNFVKNAGQYVIRSDKYNQSMLKGYSDNIMRQFLLGYDKDRVFTSETNFEKYYSDESVREGIKKEVLAVDSLTNGRLGKQRAEEFYSLSRGKLALEFNINENAVTELERMQKEGFVLKSASEVMHQFTNGYDSDFIINHPDSPFNKNLLIDLGESLGKDRYVAVPYMPVSVNGENIVENKPMKAFHSLMSSYEELQDYYNGNYGDNKSKDDLVAKMTNKRTQLIEELGLYTGGKEGVLANMNYRMRASVGGVTSSSVIINPSDSLFKKALDTNASKNARAVERNWHNVLSTYEKDTYKALLHINDEAVTKATYQGKSLLQHYSEGNYINFRFGGIEQFEKLGVFDEKYMKSVGVSTRDEMIHKLETEGIMTNTIRTPSIYINSSTPTMMYLDKTLNGTNKTKMSIAGQLAFNGDNDADQISSSIMKIGFRDGREIDSLQYAHKAQKGYVNEAWQDIHATYNYTGRVTNKYYQEKAMKTLVDDTEKLAENSSFIGISGSKRVYAAFGMNSFTAESAIMKNTNTIRELTEIYNKHYNTNYSIIDTTEEAIQENLDKLFETMDEQSRNRYDLATRIDIALGRTEIEGQAKVRKSAIGEVNNELQKLRRASELVYGTSDDPLKQRLIQDFAVDVEQEVISSKKGTIRYYTSKGIDFKNALTQVINRENDQGKARKELMKWLDNPNNKGIYDKIDENIIALKSEGMVAENYTRENFVNDLFVSLRGIYYSNNSELDRYNQIGVSKRITDASHLEKISKGLQNISPNQETSFIGKALNHNVKAGLSDSQVVQIKKKRTEEYINLFNEKARATINKSAENDQSIKQMIKTGFKETAQSLHQGIKNFTESKTGIAAMALATAYMITGYQGANASQPNDMAAQQIREENEPTPQLSDYSNVRNNTSGAHGYVINVSGSGSPNAIKRTKSFMNTTVANSMNNDVNINMNIMDSSGNINDRYVEQLISKAIQ